MTMPAFAGARMLAKQDKFSSPDTSVDFVDMFLEHKWLETAAIFRPVMLDIKYLRGVKLTGTVVLEQAIPQKFSYLGAEFLLIDGDRSAAKMIHLDTYHETVPVLSPFERQAMTETPGGQEWLESGLALTGPTGIVSGQRIVLNGPNSKARIFIVASPTTLRSPIFRLRRGATAQVDTSVGIGDGTTKDFTISLSRTPICPKSVKVTFTDAVGLNADALRDSGDGKIVSIPPEFFNELTHGIHSAIDYATGDLILHFNANHIPAAGSDIVVAYEYFADGIRDETEYEVCWEFDE